MPKTRNKVAKESATAIADLIYNTLRQVGNWSGDGMTLDRRTDRRMYLTLEEGEGAWTYLEIIINVKEKLP